MALRADGSDVAPTPEAVARAYPEATGRLALFVHGLCESDASWTMGAERHHGDSRVTYGSQLRDDLGLTPLYLRYNTGRCLDDNARDLADLLEELVAVWPVPVDEIVLIGHSMGGLVVRGACHAGDLAGHAWTAAVRHVFCLGTPHLGARLEQGAEALARALDRLPETRPAGRLCTPAARGEGPAPRRLSGGRGRAAIAASRPRRRRPATRRDPFLAHASYFRGRHLPP
ncbi:MAG: alpha/beta fold hydrolase [Nocardioides sp.]